MPVDLYGVPADYPAVNALAKRHGLKVIADAAQSFGGALQGGRVGKLADVTCTSFFPAKPLGCYGDGGAVFTDDPDLAGVMKSIRVHGQGSGKYDIVRLGLNARLDTLQAAILLPKLAILEDEIRRRGEVAARYSERLAKVVQVPPAASGVTSAWAQYTIQLDGRDRVAERLKAVAVPTAVYYPKPMHHQAAYERFAPGAKFATAERIAGRVLSLPMHPYLDTETIDYIATSVAHALYAPTP